ncbi:MAG: hypothetical protein ACTHLV_00180 [Achromobacter mucicolens]
MSLSPSIEWLAASVRVSFFFAKPVGTSGGLFEALTGRKPEAIHQQPQLGQCMEVGSWQTGPSQLLVQAAVNRIDFIVQGLPAMDRGGFPVVGHPASTMQELAHLASAWAVQQEQFEVVRVALGTAALAPCSNLPEASKIAMSVLPRMDIDVGRVEDLSVQFNFPTHSQAVDKLRINRVTKVGAVTIETMSMSPAEAKVPTFARSFAAQYDLDLNTDASRTAPFEATLICDLVGELTSIAEKAYSGAPLLEGN